MGVGDDGGSSIASDSDGLAPVLVSELRSRWFPFVVVMDASSTGGGVVAAPMAPAAVAPWRPVSPTSLPLPRRWPPLAPSPVSLRSIRRNGGL